MLNGHPLGASKLPLPSVLVRAREKAGVNFCARIKLRMLARSIPIFSASSQVSFAAMRWCSLSRADLLNTAVPDQPQAVERLDSDSRRCAAFFKSVETLRM